MKSRSWWFAILLGLGACAAPGGDPANDDDAVVDDDGKLRFVIAHGKTPHPNWIETGGHREGWMTFRWVGERESTVTMPTVLRVKRTDVAEVVAARSGGGS